MASGNAKGGKKLTQLSKRRKPKKAPSPPTFRSRVSAPRPRSGTTDRRATLQAQLDMMPSLMVRERPTRPKRPSK